MIHLKKNMNCSMIKNNTAKKYLFALKNIDTQKIDQSLEIQTLSNFNQNFRENPVNTTKISELSSVNQTISFLDEAKKSHKCIVSMIDFNTHRKLTDILHNFFNCFWCRNIIPNNVDPIGCPIKYIPSQAIKNYYSEISKDHYTIKEDITNKKIHDLNESTDERIEVINKNYYLTDGIFCSFNCCKSYIKDNKNNSMYSLSEMLLLKIYNQIYPDNIPFIEEAPHWRKLMDYGGNLTIEEFRDSFNKIEYKGYGHISDIPQFKSIGFIFEEKIKF